MTPFFPILFSPETARHVHLLGIGGCGMSGLARLLTQAGHRVSGSDVSENSEVQQLRAGGIHVRCGHSTELESRPDLAVFSAAIIESNPELTALRRAGIEVMTRGDFLAKAMQEREGIAVSGTHGKTTTTAMLAHVLTHAGFSPSYCIGGDVPVLGGKSSLGQGRWFVAEADESDATLAQYAPRFGVILNIEEEHLDFYRDLDAILSVFQTFASRTKEKIFYCADDAGAVRVCKDLPHAVSFGTTDGATFNAFDVRLEKNGSTFRVRQRGETLGTISLQIPGAHNVSNALAAATVAVEAGVPFSKIAEALAAYTGAKRRFEKKFDDGNILVLDDYAHHPTEIRATIAGARQLGKKRVVVAFQPHRYTRTKWLRQQFGSAFAMADKVFITEVYAASEAPIDGVNGQTVFDAVKATGQRDVEYAPTLEALTQRLLSEVEAGDVILVVGAGNITKVAEEIAVKFSKRNGTGERMTEAPNNEGRKSTSNIQHSVSEALRQLLSTESVVRANEPMTSHTTLRVGGLADVWIEPSNESDLAAVIKYCRANRLPLTITGRGSNLLVRDGGIRGVVVNLRHPFFSRIEIQGEQMTAGAGARMRAIVHSALDAGLTGFEFMEGIPASLGGALRMNAGAMGGSTFDMVESVRFMNPQGEVTELKRGEIEVNYRDCALFANGNGHGTNIALSAVLRGRRGDAVDIRRTLQRFEQHRRDSQPSAPSAGCIFKNPLPDLGAGKLIDELNLKGTRVGGAFVSDRHANFIVTERGATASHVLQLIELIREKAARERGIQLRVEVEILGEA